MYMHTYTVIEYWQFYRTIPFGSYIVAGVCIHNPDNINSCERVPEEARYCMALLLQ